MYSLGTVGFVTKSESSKEVIRRVSKCKQNLIKGSNYYTLKAKSKPIIVYLNGVEVARFSSAAECGRVMNLDPSSIRKQIKGKLKSVKGYTFGEVI